MDCRLYQKSLTLAAVLLGMAVPAVSIVPESAIISQTLQLQTQPPQLQTQPPQLQLPRQQPAQPQSAQSQLSLQKLTQLQPAQPQLPQQKGQPKGQQERAQSTAQTRWRDSLSVLNQLIAVSPWSADLHLRKAAVNLELQQWQYAAEEYGLVLQHEPQNLAALFFRAYANTHLRHYDLARNDYNDLLAVVPRHYEGRLSLAYVLQQMNRRQEAIDQLNQLVEQHPDSASGYALRASLEHEARQDEAALYDWQRALTLDPKNVSYVVAETELLLALGRREEARRTLDEAVSRGIPRGLLIEWYRRCGR